MRHIRLGCWFGFVVLMATLPATGHASAQDGRRPQDAGVVAYGTGSREDRVQIMAQGTAISYTPQLEVAVPAGLIVEPGMSCQAVYYDVSSGSIPSETNLGCSAEVEASQSSVTWVIARADDVGGYGLNRVDVTFTVRIPANVPAGTTYTISAPTSGFEVATQDITAPNLTPTPLPRMSPLAEATLIPNGATSGSPLVFIPNSMDARLGERINLDIDFVRLQGVESVAVWVYAEAMKITNVDMTLIDLAGQSACSPGTEGDLTPPRGRAYDVFEEPNRLPTEFDLEVRPSVKAGDQLQVCMEMVLFAGDQELASWNATATVNVVAR